MKHLITRKDSYHDSIVLMGVSAELQELDGVEHVTVAMGTPLSLERLGELGFAELLVGVEPSDLLIAIDVDDEGLVEVVEDRLTELLKPKSGEAAAEGFRPPDIQGALAVQPGTNLALISVPGQYAGYEAERALRAGLHVMLFSDNVGVDDEVALKEEGGRRGLLVMGPDCGTAILGGKPLAFANVVRRGDVGVVGASGTGIQEVTSLLDRAGVGISQAIGTGGRDLSEEVAGRTMLQAIRALEADRSSRVIVVVSKPPAEAVARAIISALEGCETPSVVHFVGRGAAVDSGSVRFAATLEEAATIAASFLGREPDSSKLDDEASKRALRSARGRGAEQRFLRGYFTGGTLCDEALFILREAGLAEARSNIHPDRALRLADPRVSEGHSLIDLGDDIFTAGRPHPMIEPSTRIERMRAEMDDGAVAVWLLDCVLGHGSHDDPAGAVAPTIVEARQRAEARGGSLTVISSVTGTSGDPQGYESQVRSLAEAGAAVLSSNARAARLAAEVLTHEA